VQGARKVMRPAKNADMMKARSIEESF